MDYRGSGAVSPQKPEPVENHNDRGYHRKESSGGLVC